MLVRQVAVVSDVVTDGGKHADYKRQTKKELVPVGSSLDVTENKRRQYHPQSHASKHPAGPGVARGAQAHEAQGCDNQSGYYGVCCSCSMTIVQHKGRQDYPSPD